MTTSTNPVETTTGTFNVADGTTLFERSWVVAEPRGNVIVSHGFGEHSGRYQHIADRLNAEGYSVFAYDHRNHGKSPGAMGFIPALAPMLSDYAEFQKHVAPKLGNAPVFLLGHSMGSLIASTSILDYKPDVAGVILSSGAFQIAADVAPLTQKISAILAVIFPRLPVHTLDPAFLSHDPAEVKAYEDDELVYHGKIVARTGHTLMSGIKAVRARAAEFTLPVLFLHGTEDRLAETGGSHFMHEHVSSTDKTLKIYEGAYHEVFNDTDRETFMNDVVEWLNAHTS